MKKILSMLFLLLSMNMICYEPAFAYSNDESVNIAVYEKTHPSVVFIEAVCNNEVSTGTGIIVDKSGLILTSSHVIDNGAVIEVTTGNGECYKAEIVYKPVSNQDLMLIKISTKNDLKPIALGNFEDVKVGQKVLAVGNPFGFSGTLTTGIVSRIDYAKNKIQTDASINPGCSGGPILNTNGEVIGISQSIYNPDNNKSNIGIGFAIPVSEVKTLLKTYKNSKS